MKQLLSALALVVLLSACRTSLPLPPPPPVTLPYSLQEPDGQVSTGIAIEFAIPPSEGLVDVMWRLGAIAHPGNLWVIDPFEWTNPNHVEIVARAGRAGAVIGQYP